MFAERLKWVRERRLRMGARELSRELKQRSADAAVSHVSIRRYESGERDPGVGYLFALADLSGLDAGWILTGEGDMHPVEPDAKAAALDAIAEIVESLKRPDDVADLPERRREIARRRAIAERWWRHLEEQAESGPA